jgi:Transposase
MNSKLILWSASKRLTSRNRRSLILISSPCDSDVFTADLYRLADWLQDCGVKTVALQSTGVYWIPLYHILEERGFEAYLVNARHTKNLPGRKSDVQESQWLLKLHTYGLLNNSFQPPLVTEMMQFIADVGHVYQPNQFPQVEEDGSASTTPMASDAPAYWGFNNATNATFSGGAALASFGEG